MAMPNAWRSSAVAALAALWLAACGGEVDGPRASGGSMTAGEGAAVSNQQPVVSHVSFTPPTATAGQALQAVVVAADPDGDAVSLSYEWRVGTRRILSDGASIQVPENWSNQVVEVVVTASDGDAVSEPVIAKVRIANRAPRVTDLEIETVDLARGSGEEPHWRVSSTGEDPDGDFVTFTYEWLVNGRTTGESRESFPKSLVGRGDEITVRVTATDGQSTSNPLVSPIITIQNAPPVISSAPPAPDPGGLFSYRPTVEDPDGDTRFSFRLIEGPDTMELDARTGELSWRPGTSRPGRHAIKLEVADEQGARSTQRFEITVRVEAGTPAAPR